MSDRFEEVMREIPYVREALGWIPLVTPTSQIVGTQAMLNVKFGRWKMFSQPAMDVALNKYGRTPGVVDPDVRKLAEEKSGQKSVEGRPADLLEPRMEKLKAELTKKGLPTTDEAAVLYAMFPTETEKVLKGEFVAPPVPKTDAPAAPTGPGKRYSLTIEGKKHDVLVEELA